MDLIRRLIKGILAFTLASAALYGISAQAGATGAKKPAKQAVAKSAAAKPAPAKSPEPAAQPAARTVELAVTQNGFEPSPVNVKKGQPLHLVVTRKTDDTCATDLVIKDYNITQPLPLNQPVAIDFTPTQSGQLKYGCAMGQMVSGVLLVE